VSLALGYVPAALATPEAPAATGGTEVVAPRIVEGFEIEIIGHRRPARLLSEPVLDPSGHRMRA
jgi:dimethylglycine dehydrogenase